MPWLATEKKTPQRAEKKSDCVFFFTLPSVCEREKLSVGPPKHIHLPCLASLSHTLLSHKHIRSSVCVSLTPLPRLSFYIIYLSSDPYAHPSPLSCFSLSHTRFSLTQTLAHLSVSLLFYMYVYISSPGTHLSLWSHQLNVLVVSRVPGTLGLV